MSDTEDGDGGDDGFDKEAEREKLREQYERDQQRREATQQMSDLLLKGATMTNAHCDQCGSPIFRYEGEEFCPTCAGTRAVPEEASEGEGEGGDAATGQSTDAATGQSTDAATGQSTDAATGQSTDEPGERGAGADRPDATSPAGSDADAGDATASAGGDAPAGDDLEAARARLDERASDRSTGSRSTDLGSSTARRADPPVGDSPVRQGEVPSMAQTRASLRRAIVSLSEQAAQSDDPNRAHDLLKGAREASEALAALEGTTGE